MDTMSEYNTKENLSTFAKLLKEKLQQEGVSASQESLEKTLEATREEFLVGCDQCANGWHW